MQSIAFIGGGNMAAAIIGGLLEAGRPAASIVVVEPHEDRREQLAARFAIDTISTAGPSLDGAAAVVWAVKPQVFRAAAAPCRSHVGKALQLSIMAGIRSETIAEVTGAARIVRAMPNTPALIGRGIAGVFGRAGADAADRSLAESLLASTGELVWVEREDDLDAVTALSGSGPAYAFHVLEAMLAAGREMGLAESDARRLAVQTLAGAAALAGRSEEPMEVLRRNVTSPGGTTAAAMAILEARHVKSAFVDAILAARDRARQLGAEFSASPD